MLLKTKLLISLGVVGVVSTTGTGVYYLKNKDDSSDQGAGSSLEVGSQRIQQNQQHLEDAQDSSRAQAPTGAGGGSGGTEVGAVGGDTPNGAALRVEGSPAARK